VTLSRLLLALFFVAGAAAAQPVSRTPAPDNDFDTKPWEEQKSRLPSNPNPENLARIYAGPTTNFEFYVDAASVSVSQDGVVRYTLVARSSSGATNVSYEGMRCKTYDRKLYALGRFDGAWSPARDPQWVPIGRAQAKFQNAALAEDFFCPQRIPVPTAEEAMRALKRGNQPGPVR